MNLLNPDAQLAEPRDDVGKYLTKDFVPDPAKRYRWYFSGGNQTTPFCEEYDVLSETKCFETIGYKGPCFPFDKNMPKKVCKSAIKKFAHRSPVAALYALTRRQAKIIGYRKVEMERASARCESAKKALREAGELMKFSGLRTDIPEYEVKES